MRYLLALVVVSAMLFVALMAFGRTFPRAEAPRLLALAYPTSITVGERVALFGGFEVPAGRYEVGAYACEADACRRVIWRFIEGPQEYWVGLGSIGFGEEALTRAEASVEIRVFDRSTPYSVVVATWSAPVHLLPASPIEAEM